MKSSFLKSIFLTKVIFAEQALKPGFRLSSSVADDENSIPPGALFPDTLSGPGARKLPQIKKMLDSEMSEYTIGDLSKIIKNYGCYCNIGSKQVGHKFNYNSNPVDELDHLCKQLNRSLKCLEIDYQNGIYQQQCDKMSSYRWYVDEDEGIKCFSGDEEASWKELKDDGYRVIKEKIEKLESKKFVEKKKKDKSQKGEKNLLGYSNCQYDLCSLERHFVYQVKALLRNKDYWVGLRRKRVGLRVLGRSELNAA